MSLRKRRNPKHEVEMKLERAEAALDEALQEKMNAEEQTSWRDRLYAGWERVHERNNLSELFIDAYRRAK